MLTKRSNFRKRYIISFRNKSKKTLKKWNDSTKEERKIGKKILYRSGNKSQTIILRKTKEKWKVAYIILEIMKFQTKSQKHCERTIITFILNLCFLFRISSE